MHVAIDARMVRHTGIGTYLSGLLADLPGLDPSTRYTYLLPRAELSAYAGTAPNVSTSPCDAPLYSLSEQLRVFAAASAAGADTLYCPHYVTPWLWRNRLVVTVHDLIHLLFPTTAAQRWYARLALGHVARLADPVLADSARTLADLRRFFPVPAARARVVYPGIDLAAFPSDGPDPSPILARYGLRPPYFLHVGQWKPSKNLPALLQAFAATDLARQGYQLALAGRPDPRHDLRHLAATLSCREAICFPGYVADGDLPALYRGAFALVFPSLYEGFGLPPLEAMASGCPVISSDAASLPEVVGDAGLLFPAGRPDALAAALLRLAGDAGLRLELRARGLARAGVFDRRNTAQSVIDALRG